MRRSSILLLLAVLSSGCAVAPDITADADTPTRPLEEYLADFEDPDSEISEIGPDEELLCRGERSEECAEDGALRWSLPLEGTYLLRSASYEPLALRHVDTGAHGLLADPWSDLGLFTAIEIEGRDTVVYAENARIRALDAATGELRWRVDLGEALDDGSFLHSGSGGLHQEGDDLHVIFDRGLVVLALDDGEVDTVVETSHSLGTLSSVADGHALFRQGREDPLFTAIDLEEAEVVWNGRVRDDVAEEAPEYVGAYGTHAYFTWNTEYDPALLHLSRWEGWFARVDVRTGELEHLIVDDFEGVRSFSKLSGIHPDGYVVLHAVEDDVQYAYDFVTEELLWEAEGTRGDLTPVNTPSGPAFEHRGGEILDAVTGESLPEDTEVQALSPATPRHVSLTDHDRERDRLVSWVELRDGQPGPVGLGTYGLLSTDEIVVALACAPDGIGEIGAESPFEGVPCEKPRLYALNQVA
ncbi:outer membrane protein assembly factor BamB family protein [Nocardiopsis sp. NPDC055551]